jgi:ribulose bisphosphate carboxylase small subunit
VINVILTTNIEYFLKQGHIINREFNSLQEQEIYFLQIVQTSSGAQATSHSEYIGSSFPG